MQNENVELHETSGALTSSPDTQVDQGTRLPLELLGFWGWGGPAKWWTD